MLAQSARAYPKGVFLTNYQNFRFCLSWPAILDIYSHGLLRRLTKRVVKNCHGCRRFQAQAFSSPPLGNLPKDRTERQTPFQVVGVDYPGPLKYRKGAKTEGKAYVLLYACSLICAMFLDLLPSLETTEFLASFKRFIGITPKGVFR